MEKQVQFFGSSDSGIFCQSLFGSAGCFEKVGGAPAFSDWETGEALRKYIRSLSKEDRKNNCFVLVNALGAGEYYGSNINSDYFPWNALTHSGDDYGYLTFLAANAFQHHKNKDPTRAFGKPVLSVLNTGMKRVELIVKLFREKAKLEGADGIITRIDAGEFPDVSMGCKVPFDICSICGHRSKTKDDYCEHMRPPEELRHKFGPNKILDDGRRIYVVNTIPRFFDLSFVFIGADKTAKVMAKLASKGQELCFGDVCAIPRPSADVAYIVDQMGRPYEVRGEEKTASVECCVACEKLAMAFDPKMSWRKTADIVKEIPTGAFSMKRIPELESEEPDLSDELLSLLSESPLPSALGATANHGIVLKPEEFQRIVLLRMGENELADSLRETHGVFRPVDEFDGNISIDCTGEIDNCLNQAIHMLKQFVRTRSAFGLPFSLRLTFKSRGGKKTLATPAPITHPLLDKISSAYNGYRRDVLMKLSQAEEVVRSDPRLRQAILGDELVNMFSKTSSVSPVVSLDSVAYFMGAHLPNRSLLSGAVIAESIAAHNQQLLQEEELSA